MQRAWVIRTIAVSVSLCIIVSVANGQKFKATSDVTEKLKEAYALLDQGQPERALAIVLPIYQKDPEIWVAWWPKWVFRVVKEPLPDPYAKSEIMRRGIEGGQIFLLTVRKSTNARWLVAEALFDLGRYQEALPLFEEMQRRIKNAPAIGPDMVGRCRQLIAQGYRPPKPPPKNTWLPLPLRYLEEDYFILVPLDEACKVLGLGCSIAPNPKMSGGKSIRVTKPDAPNTAYRFFLGHPIVERLENGKGHTGIIAYAPFEEDGKIWVPFYWLTKQAGIRWWEVQDGKIYVVPK